MSDSIQTQGKTVDEAIAEACLQLGLRRDEVDVRVTQEPKSGLLGFIGGRPAKVAVRKKPERHRGRGRDNRSDEGGAHSLGRGRGGRGRSRGGRGRGGRDGQQADAPRNENNAPQNAQQNSQRNDSRGNDRGNERGNERNSEGGGRGRSRGGRGRGGRDNSRYDNRSNNRNEGQSDSRNDARDSSRDSSRNDSHQSPRAEAVSAAPREGRDNARGDERGGRDDQRRSRRGSRGGRGRSRRNNPENSPPVNEVADAAVVNENIVVQREEQAPPAAVVEASVTPVTPVEAEPSSAASAVTPETAAAPKVEVAPVVAATPEVKKKKRGGWGGGLGAKLRTKPNPSVPEKPAAEAKPATYEPKLTAPAPTPTPLPSSNQAPQYEERSRRPSQEIDEVIISGVQATKYAQPVTGVTEETLDATLSDMTKGLMDRAGFGCEVSVTEGEYRQVRITSEEESAGLLIGRHGQTVDAVEHLVERMASNSIDDRVRMNLDINEYRQRRQEDLFARVADAVADVRESGKAYHMESMSARERRLVHLEAEGVEGIRTFTMSGNGGKHVVLATDDEDENDDRHDG